MIGERILGTGLTLLSIALIIGPIVAAFAVQGWDWRAAVMPSQDEIEQMQAGFQGNVDTMKNVLESIENVTARKIDELTSEITIFATSEFDTEVRVGEFSCEVVCAEHPGARLGSIGLKEPVKILPRTTATVTFVLRFTSEGRAHLNSRHPAVDSVLVDLERVVVEIWGISIAPPEKISGVRIPLVS